MCETMEINPGVILGCIIFKFSKSTNFLWAMASIANCNKLPEGSR